MGNSRRGEVQMRRWPTPLRAGAHPSELRRASGIRCTDRRAGQSCSTELSPAHVSYILLRAIVSHSRLASCLDCSGSNGRPRVLSCHPQTEYQQQSREEHEPEPHPYHSGSRRSAFARRHVPCPLVTLWNYPTLWDSQNAMNNPGPWQITSDDHVLRTCPWTRFAASGR